MNAPPENRMAPLGKAPLRTYSTTTDANHTTLGPKINAEIELADEAALLAEGTADRALAHARRAGEYLIEAKAAIGHGKWHTWLADNCPHLHERRAQRLIRFARNPTLLSDSVTGALKLLAKPKPAPEDATPDLPDFEAVLRVGPPAVWVGPYDEGVRFLTPSADYPGCVFVDHVVTNGADDEKGLFVARRPFKIEALGEFFPGTMWVRHTEQEDAPAIDFIRAHLPERTQDCIALGIMQEVRAAT